ncbi:hypothetical protein GWG54_08095 [Natronococcus sp. JC468]|uniref:hypothetical protein n=1 Tax=Natronococcus sp. JC468 TaxID=1961921 RepID=UPI00143A7756|nr:hypothetical protein [Natronococcus sp. JC468]NKE35780.1 hypothetical protein [Natronococcus sp. JC468]
MSGDETRADDSNGTDGFLSDTAAFWIAAIAGLVAAVGSVWLSQGPFYQTVLRVRPTVAGGGVGTGWVAGNTEPLLNALISVLHFADVIMGVFIILMVVVHWAAFRRLADRMRPPGGAEPSARADGGDRAAESDRTSGGDRA